MKRPAIDEFIALTGAVIARTGVTSGAGAATGRSIIDAGLIGVGANSFVNMLVVLYSNDDVMVDSARILTFNNGTGEMTLEHAYKGVAAAIPAGVEYTILTLPFATAISVASLADGVHVDDTLGAAGTAFPLGTPSNPVDNIADALVIAATFKTPKIFLHGQGWYSLPSDLTRPYVFVGDSRYDTDIDFDNRNAFGSLFKELVINNVETGGGITVEDCVIDDAQFNGSVFNSRLNSSATWTVDGHSTIVGLFCDWTSHNTAKILFSGAGRHVRVIDCNGRLSIDGMADVNADLNIYGDSLGLTIEATNTLGTISLYGNISTLTNLTGGATVINYTDSAKLNQLIEPEIPSLIEVWQSEEGMPEADMEWTNPATGTPWTVQTSGIYREFYTAPAASENARLVGRNMWMVAPSNYGTNTIYKKIILEYVVKLTTLANFDNAPFIIGLTPNKTDTRASNNIIGFSLLADVLQALTDNGGAETITAIPAAVLTNVNKLRIEIYAGHVKFFVNEVQVADHITNLPNVPMYRDIYIANEAGGATGFELMGNRMWAETVVRS
jgi:hypothetical protein